MFDLFLQHAPTVLAIVGAIAIAFLTPLGSQIVAQFFARRPAFAVQSPIIDTDLRLVVEPANAAARKRRPLGLRVRGINIPDAGTLAGGKQIRWNVDLSPFDWLNEVCKPGEDFEIEFFFRPENASEKVLVRFTGPTPSKTNGKKSNLNRVATITDFALQVGSKKTLRPEFSEGVISRTFPTSGANFRWDSVHDGKQVTIFDLDNFEVKGNGCKILAEPRYAWVFNFQKCKSIALRDLILGHTEAGYCSGGVIRFISCENIIIEKCELFGSGTYGLEFVDCNFVEVIDVTVRNCTYGGMNLIRAKNFLASNCTFDGNRGFDLIQIDSSVNNNVMIKKSTFSRNDIEGFMFRFDDGDCSFYVNDCKFIDYKWRVFSNCEHLPTQNRNHFENNLQQDRS